MLHAVSTAPEYGGMGSGSPSMEEFQDERYTTKPFRNGSNSARHMGVIGYPAVHTEMYVMTRSRTLGLTLAAAMIMPAAIVATPAAAEEYRYSGDGYDYRDDDRYERRESRYDRRYDRRDDRRYDRRYDRRVSRCDNGTGGTIIGAVAGGLAGRELAGRRGDRTTATIIGGALGALAGRAIDKSNDGCRR
jgi:hypothetical protein